MQLETLQGYRLSPQQRHIWLLRQADRHLPLRAVCQVNLDGELDKQILKFALQDVVSRHEILRTTFQYLPGMSLPLQVITDDGFIEDAEYDLTGLEQEEQRKRIDGIFEQAKQTDFNLEDGPLLHVSVARLSPNRHVMYLNLPAFCADAATLDNLVREIAVSYRAHTQSGESSTANMQYADLSEIFNELLESEETKAGREFWLSQSVPSPDAFRLSLESSRSPVGQFHPRLFSRPLVSLSHSDLLSLASASDTSLRSILLSAWLILLHRLSSQPHIVVGSAFDGRTYEELEGALGLFAKYLPIGTNFEPSTTALDLVRQVEAALAEASLWQECFDWELVAGHAGQPSSSQYFAYLFELHEQAEQIEAQGLGLRVERSLVSIDKYKMSLKIVVSAGEMRAEAYYDGRLFESGEVEVMLDQYETLVRGLVESLEKPVRRLELVSEVELEKQLERMNASRMEYDNVGWIHEQIERQAEEVPDRIAVVRGEEAISYEELNRRANQLSRYLAEKGVETEQVLDVCAQLRGWIRPAVADRLSDNRKKNR